MNKALKLSSLLIISFITFLASHNAIAETLLKTYILAETKSGDVATIAKETKDKLTAAGFEIAGGRSDVEKPNRQQDCEAHSAMRTSQRPTPFSQPFPHPAHALAN